MKDSHCSQIAHALVDGLIVDEKWLHVRHIRNQHKRLDTIGYETMMCLPQATYEKDAPINPPSFWPVKNIGSRDGHLTNIEGGKTHCGRYYLPAKYRPALRRAIKKMGW